MGFDPKQRGQGRSESAQRREKSCLPDALAQIDAQCCFAKMGSLAFALEPRLKGENCRSEEAQQSQGRDFPPDHNSRPEKTSADSAE